MATMSSSPTTGPASLPPLTRKPQAKTRKISMEGVDNQALTEKAVQSPRVMMITVNLDNITSPERVET